MKTKDLQKRMDTIIDAVVYANEVYNRFRENPEIQTIENYKKVKQAVKDFYEDKDNEVQVSRFGYDNFPILMLKSFEKEYPKQYKLILKELNKKNIDVENLIKYNNGFFERLISEQNHRKTKVWNLMNEICEYNGFPMNLVYEAYNYATEKIDEIHLAQNTSKNPENVEINHYKLCVESFNLCKEKTKETKKEVRQEKNKDSQIITK